MINCKEITDYITLIRSGQYRESIEQFQLCDYVEKCFELETLTIDLEELENYLSLQKYFPFKLLEWELFCFALHNCVYSQDGSLRWPDLLIMVGRGAGKNGYLSFEDFCLISQYNKVKNYDIDICANAEEQAKTSFEDVYAVLEEHQAKLQNHFYWSKELIKNLKTGSKLRFRTSNAKTKDGGRPGKVDFDEYHQYEDYVSIQVFKTGLGKKRHPRTTITTTNGDVRGGPLDQIIARAEQILKGSISDNGMLPFICRLGNEKEVDDPLNWDKPNPSLRFFPELLRTLHKEYIDYKEDPISNSSFMVKRMNLPRGNVDVEVTSWDNVMSTGFDIIKDEKGTEISRTLREIPDLTGCTCVVGIDYAKTTDFVVAGLLFKFKGIHYWLSHTWVCSRCPDLERIKAPIKDWETQKLLTMVDEVEVAPEIPALWLAEQADKYCLTVLGMDNYRYTLLARALRDVGFDPDKGGSNNIHLIRPSNQMMIAPVINSLFARHAIVWGDNPLMRWYTYNACRIVSQAGNETYGKIEPKSRKTDGFMALIAAECVAGDLEDSGDRVDFDFNVYTY